MPTILVPALASLPLLAAFGAPFLRAAGEARPQPSPKMLAITVDDLPIGGPDEGVAAVEDTNRRIVAALSASKVPAVGFVNEEKLYRDGEVDRRIGILRSWLDAGLELGNHTYSHPDFHKVGRSAYEEEVIRGETVTKRLLAARGRKLRWFRQTFLRTGRTLEDRDALAAWLAARGYVAAPVTIENDDWYFNARYVVALRNGDRELAERIAAAYVEHWTTMLGFYESLTDRLFAREIPQVVLMHANRLNADRLLDVLELFRQRGYAFSTLDAALADPAYRTPDPYAGPWGKSWLQRWALSRGIDTLGKEPDPPAWVSDLPEK
jgi:peptidoglycan/xylan/chitin deacetylase (PgdA/CDA1 family)